MENIQNIADESSDDEGFEVDENEVDTVSQDDYEEDDSTDQVNEGQRSSLPSSSSRLHTISERQTFANSEDYQPTLDTSPNHDQSDGNEAENLNAIDIFAQARKVPLSHQVKGRLYQSILGLQELNVSRMYWSLLRNRLIHDIPNLRWMCN